MVPKIDDLSPWCITWEEHHFQLITIWCSQLNVSRTPMSKTFSTHPWTLLAYLWRWAGIEAEWCVIKTSFTEAAAVSWLSCWTQFPVLWEWVLCFWERFFPPIFHLYWVFLIPFIWKLHPAASYTNICQLTNCQKGWMNIVITFTDISLHLQRQCVIKTGHCCWLINEHFFVRGKLGLAYS